jgi:type IV secretory pathway VirJ component
MGRTGKRESQRAAEIARLKEFSPNSKIQDGIFGRLRDATPEWVQRKSIDRFLIQTGALPKTTSNEVARIQVQKALNALDKKLLRFNEDHGYSWKIERVTGKGLRLAQQLAKQIASPPTVEGRLERVEQILANLEPSVERLQKTVKEIQDALAYVKQGAPVPVPEFSTLGRKKRAFGNDESLKQRS